MDAVTAGDDELEQIACGLPWFKAVKEIREQNGGGLKDAATVARGYVSRNPDSILAKSYFELDAASPSRQYFR
jgi:hypothetical protein